MLHWFSFGKQTLALLVVGGLLMLGAYARAASSSQTLPTLQWKVNDLSKTEVHIPAKGRPTLLLFIMVGQKRSNEALNRVQKVIEKMDALQVVAVVSGKSALEKAPRLKTEFPWLNHVVIDLKYQRSGEMSVHVWPTAVVVDETGQCVGRLAGLSDTLSHDLKVYLAFANKKLDGNELEKKLKQRTVVRDSPQEQANLNLRVAQRLLNKGLLSAARQQLLKGLQSHPEHDPLRLALAQVYLQMGKLKLAGEQLEKVTSGETSGGVSGGGWDLVRGRIALAEKQWDKAKEYLLAVVKQNPRSMVAFYLLGRVFQHQGKWEQAAIYFRQAFEQSHGARQLSPQEKQ